MANDTLNICALLLLLLPLLLLATSSIQYARCLEDKDNLKIPDPFGADSESGGLNRQGYYAIESYQVTNSHRHSTRIDVTEYFSLKTGVTYSILSNKDDTSASPILIVVDSYTNKSYIIRDYDPNRVLSGKLDCEIDHRHGNRQTFPWQYKYASTGNKQRAESFIYGVGAIWLNAIKHRQDLRLDQTHPTKYSWLMRGRDIEVELMFDRPSSQNEDYSKTRLESVQVTKRHAIHTDDRQNTYAVGTETKSIYVSSFEHVTNAGSLVQITNVISRCRRQAKDHRAFPSLLSAVSSSPQRMFYIDYMLTKFPAARDLASGTYDNRRHRHVFDHEYRTEYFSFQREMSSVTYVSGEDTQEHPVDQADTFIKKFTDTLMSQSTRKPSSVTYHLVENDDQLSACYSYQDEPDPAEPYMVRPVHFYTRQRSKIVGQLAGLGALLMNAADSHHLQFQLFRQQIDAVKDPADIRATTRVYVNEWRMRDKHTSRMIKFFLEQPGDSRVGQEIRHLIRVDICDDSGKNQNSNLLYRYDIFEIATEVSRMELEHAFDLPQECFVNKPDHYDSDSESESEHKDPAYYDDSDTDDESDDNEDEDEDEFEFDPGNLVEHMKFPKFYEYLDGRPAYEIESEITKLADKFHLKERVDVESEETILIVSSAATSNSSQQPVVEFHVNYNSELVFRIVRDECELMDAIDKPDWLKLISSSAKYFKSPSSSDDELIESDKLPLAGVGALWRQASESEHTRYDGFTTIEENGIKYNEMKWTLESSEEGPDHSEMLFVFRYDLAQHLKNIELKIPNKSIDLTTLNRIEFRDLDEEGALYTRLAISLKSIGYPESAHVEPTRWKLPSICNPAIEEAAKKIAHEHQNEDVTIPSLLSVIKQQRAYTVQYTVSHTSLGGPHYLSSATSLPITESFDLESHKGKLIIGIGLDRRIVYVDGAGPSSKIYTYFEHKNECKRLGTLNSLVDLGNQFSMDGGGGGGNGQSTPYGLGALWNRLARAQNGLLKIEFQIDERGFKREIRTYRVVTSHVEKFTHITEFLTLMVFIEDTSAATPKQGSAKEFKLESIDVVPKKVRGKDSKRNHRTTISVASFVPSIQEEWILPEACEKLTQQEGVQFPRLSDLIRAKGQFQMRSELTSDRGNKRTLTLMEEWIYGHNYRFQTLNMGQNYNLLIYGSSRESFDFRIAHQCSMSLWKSNERRKMNQEEREMVLDLWFNEETISPRPSLLNFAPAALWMAAERNPSEQLKLVSSMDLAPLPSKATAAEDKWRQVERELRTITWQVSSSPNERSAWRYRLTFEQVSAQQPDGGLREWHILDRIELEESDPHSEKFYIELDVVNYSYELSQKDIDERFSIPVAYGCKRSESVMNTLLEARDELQFEPNYQHKIAYEASLELMGATYAPISGSLYSTGRNLGDTIQVFSHHILSRNLNGSTRSTKTVYDRFSSIIYKIDALSGVCEIRREKQYDWRLRFEPFSSERLNSSLPDLPEIKIDDSLFESLFLNTVQLNFQPVNRWTTNGWHVSTYELNLDNIKLFEHLLQGQPATIIRRFLTYGDELKLIVSGNTTIYRHSHLDTTVYLFNEERDTVVGKLMIALDAVAGVSLAEIFKANSIEECYSNKRTSSFAFEYKHEDPKLLEWLQSNYLRSEREFLLKLLRKGNLLPTQIVGTPRISQQHREDLLLLDFRLLDAPTSVEYYKRQLQANMVDDLMVYSQMRLLPDLEHCSRWCDKEDCLAMSYCSGRVCRILTAPELRAAGMVSQVGEKIMQTAHDEACDYFYSGGFRPSSLSQFSELVQLDVARVPASSVFGLDLADQHVLPSEFYEQVTQVDSHMDKDENSEQKVYMVLEQHDLELDLDRLKKSLATVIFAHTDKLVECLDECSNLDCELVSHDPNSSSCAILKGKDEIRNLLLLTKRSDREGLIIAVRDHRDEYSRFEATALPKTHKEKFDDYSAIECASACSSRKLGCLSFDHCRPVKGSSSGKTICFLQEAHLLSESFDRSLLEPNLESSKQEFVCEHYSRSVLASEASNEEAEVEQYDWSTSSSGAGSTDIKLLTEKIHKLVVEHVKSPQIFMSALFYIIVAICIGSLLQLALIRLTGRSILFAY